MFVFVGENPLLIDIVSAFEVKEIFDARVMRSCSAQHPGTNSIKLLYNGSGEKRRRYVEKGTLLASNP